MTWQPKRLGDVFKIQLGKMLSSAAKTGTGTAPYLRNANVQWGRFDLSDLATMDFDERERLKFNLRPGDLIVCEGGEPGRCAVWEGQLENCFYQKALHRLRARNNEVDPYFGMYRLILAAESGEFAKSVTHSTIAHLPADKLAALTFLLPPIEEQRRIVGSLRQDLSKIDSLQKGVAAQLDAAQKLPLALIRESFKSERREVRLGEVLDEITQGVGEEWNKRPLWGATRAGLSLAKEPIGKSPERYKPVKAGCIFYNPMRILIARLLSSKMVKESSARTTSRLPRRRANFIHGGFITGCALHRGSTSFGVWREARCASAFCSIVSLKALWSYRLGAVSSKR